VARVAGHDVMREPRRVRAAIGLTGQYAAVDEMLTGAENLMMMGRLRHLRRPAARRRVADLLEQLDLVEAAGRRVATYLSSAFVPPETMPAGLRWLAEHQPITPITETVRALGMGGSGGDAPVALAWCAGGIAVGVVAAALLFRSRSEARP
jgi:hypothetical protein